MCDDADRGEDYSVVVAFVVVTAVKANAVVIVVVVLMEWLIKKRMKMQHTDEHKISQV